MKYKILLTFIIFLTSINGYSQNKKLKDKNHNVNKILNLIKNDSVFKTAGFAFLAIDAKTKKIISEHNPDMALRPASTQKLITTATALELYGPDYKFVTTIEYSGKIDTVKHILYGNIFIKGGGNPTLGSKYFDETKNKQFLTSWTQAIKKLCIDSVVGKVIADAEIYSKDIVPQTWTWNNMGNYYGAGATGLSIYDNYYSIYLNSSKKIGDKTIIVKTEPEIPNLTFDNAVIADSITFDNAYVYGAPYSYQRYLKGQIPLNKINFKVKGSMPDPAYITALELEKSLKKSGIKFKNNATTIRLSNLKGEKYTKKRKKIISTYSPKLSKIIAETNIHSINLYAEHCLNHIGLKLTNYPDTDSSTIAEMKFWEQKGMDMQGMNLSDGSGLSQYNCFTPRQMIFLLSYMKNKSKYFKDFYNSMAIAGKTGTIKKMFKGTIAEGNLRAKSGTVSRTKAYSGYLKSRSGREIIFSMVVNNFSCKSKEARARLEKLMIALAEFNK